ncbi:hypothetical protein MNBD_GAMMA12-3230 [hydrothermal vent metagenome]|uniref:Uncharacterized protein n=1 Tax=hydrothermal vent metagenome TaxID=652676 RepID=A0A3B0YDG7_9ZZZZ
MDINPDYLTKLETEVPELIQGECETFEEAKTLFATLSSEYRIALAIQVDQSMDVTKDTNLSKIGGLALYPSDRDWPLCEQCGEEMLLAYQIRKQDAAALPTPKGKDMLLVFTCPEECGDDQPEHEIVWLNESDVTQPLQTLRGRTTESNPLQFHPFRDHMICTEYEVEGIDFFSSHLSECEIRYPVRMIARMMEGLAEGNLDEHLERYGKNPLAQLENMNNESIDFFEAMTLYHLNEPKIGGYPSWAQHSHGCHGSYMNIIQIRWAEGFWHIVVCTECGDFYTEYQGT